MRPKHSNKLNKTVTYQLPMTPSMMRAILDHARKIGMKHTEFSRDVLSRAIAADCPLSTQQHEEKSQDAQA